MNQDLTFKISISSPEELIYQGQATMVKMPGIEGEFSVLVGHANFVSLLQEGVISVFVDGQMEKEIFIKKAIAEVSKDGCSIFVLETSVSQE